MGEALIKTLIQYSGLPTDLFTEEFEHLIVKHGYNRDTLTLDQVREILADHLQETLLEAKNQSQV